MTYLIVFLEKPSLKWVHDYSIRTIQIPKNILKQPQIKK